MTENPGSLASLWSQEDADRQEHLQFAREIARYTDPYLLPRDNATEYEGYERNYQSVGPMGMEAITSALHFSLVTPGFLFFSRDLSAEIVNDPNVDPNTKAAERQRLFLEAIGVHALMEGGLPGDEDVYRSGASFHTAVRNMIQRAILFGATLGHIEPDGRIRTFRLDNFVTRRDSAGGVLSHIIREKIDPTTLTRKQLEKAGMTMDELKDKHPKMRMHDLYTSVEWQPWTKKWVIRQVVKGNEIAVREEKVCSYISPCVRLQEGESYGRGLFSLWLGDLRTLDNIRAAIIDMAFIASKCLIAIAHGSDTKPSDLNKPTGSAFYANVTGGQITDVALLKADKLADFSIANQTAESVQQTLGQAMGLFNYAIRDAERVTALEVQRVTNQAQQLTGGAIGWLDETLLRPMVSAYYAMAREKKIIRPQTQDDKRFTRPVLLTGLAQVSKRAKADQLLTQAQLAQALGPEAMKYIRPDGFFKAYSRYVGIYEDGTIRSDDEVRAMEQAQAQREAAVAAAAPVASEAAAVGADAARAQLGLSQ